MKKEKKPQNTDLLSDFLTIPEVSQKLALSEYTVRRLLREGKIKGYKKNNRWYVNQHDIVSYLKSE